MAALKSVASVLNEDSNFTFLSPCATMSSSVVVMQLLAV